MLRLYNTMSREQEVFTPRREGRVVQMFSCGPSIYRRPHLGNYRSFVWEDVLQRYLEYSGFTVERVLNFTDVEDKAIEEAQDEGLTLEELTGPVAARFFDEAAQLQIKLPDTIPRSSTTVDQAAKLIRTLLDKGYAYWHQNNVFFDPLKFKGFGKLFRLDMSRWPKKRRRFKKDTYRGRRWNLGDFILWHGYRDGDPVSWETEIGRGRPAWNIQDPAMVTRHLGFAIDLCCGGIDNLYRHHDYNIAVIEAASGETFAPYWVHGEHLLVGGKKMSKSLGNIVYPEDLITNACTGQHVRFYLLFGHHRQRLNFTPATFRKTVGGLDGLRESLEQILSSASPGHRSAAAAESSHELIPALRASFEDHMNDDLDVRGAIDSLGEQLKKLAASSRANRLSAQERMEIDQEVRHIDTVLRVLHPAATT